VERVLASAGIEASTPEAQWLVEATTGRSRSKLAATPPEVAPPHAALALELADRRAAGEPLQYLTGLAGFRRLELVVGPGVMIPRPETEAVVDRALLRLPEGGVLVDVGTGSGAIALSVADERSDARVLATERSEDALPWAVANRDRLGLDVELIACDLFSGLPAELHEEIDVVVSNPPYVSFSERALLPADVIEHEPHEALFGGGDGTEPTRRIVTEARDWLRGEGWLVLETSEVAGEKVERLLDDAGFTQVGLFDDLLGRQRIAEGRWSAP
jgi:release factor glutamine methyltransferase